MSNGLLRSVEGYGWCRSPGGIVVRRKRKIFSVDERERMRQRGEERKEGLGYGTVVTAQHAVARGRLISLLSNL